MKVFVTGAAGFIGQAVVQELLKHGHQVLGLARSDTSAETIKKAGAEVHRGDIEDLESLRTGARAADGVIHLAFVLDFENFPRSLAIDRAAIEAMSQALSGTGKGLVIASGTLLISGQQADEDTVVLDTTGLNERVKSEELVSRLSTELGIRGSTVRLAPIIHGPGDKAFMTIFAHLARQNGFVTMVGDGSNRWPAAHRDDAAVLFRLAVEKGSPGKIYHGVAEQGLAMKDILGTIGSLVKLPVESKSVEEAQKPLGMLSHLIGRDNPTSSEKTQKELGWTPSQPGLIADLKTNYKFA